MEHDLLVIEDLELYSDLRVLIVLRFNHVVHLLMNNIVVKRSVLKECGNNLNKLIKKMKEG